MTFSSRAAACVVGALMLAGCHASALAPVASHHGAFAARSVDADLYPLVAGASWDYQLLQQQNDGAPQEREMSMAIASVTPLADGVTEAVLTRAYGALIPPPTRVRKSADAVVLSRLSDPVDGPSITILKWPLAVGTSWPGREFGGGNTETISPRGAESVEVPAGTYTAQRVDHLIHYAQGAEDVLSYWYAPGIGLVKMIERITLFQADGTAMHMTSTGSLKAYRERAAVPRHGAPMAEGASGLLMPVLGR